MRGGGSAVRFHDCTNNKMMTEMRDLKDMVSYVFFSVFIIICVRKPWYDVLRLLPYITDRLISKFITKAYGSGTFKGRWHNSSSLVIGKDMRQKVDVKIARFLWRNKISF